jgi:hypothetical protein
VPRAEHRKENVFRMRKEYSVLRYFKYSTVARSSRPVLFYGQNEAAGRKYSSTTLSKPGLPKLRLFGATAAHHDDVEPIEGVHDLDILSKQVELVCCHFTCLPDPIGI